MRFIVRPLIAGSLFLIMSSCLHGQTLSASHETAIRTLIMEVPQAMNRKDWKAYADLFSDDADWINVVGMFWHGKDNLVRAHAAYGPTVFRNGGFFYSDMVIRRVAPDVAIVVVTEHSMNEGLAPDGVTKLPPGQGRLSFVVVKRKHAWKITLGHNTGVDLEAQKYDPTGADWKNQPQK